jgi:hypothetical protein
MKTLFTGVLLISTAFADVITDWNAIVRTSIAAESAQAQSRYAAIAHLAIFEAVNAITQDYKPYLGSITPAPGASPQAATAAAAHHVLRYYYPLNAAALDAALMDSLARIPDGTAKVNGITVGQSAGSAMIAKRANDGSSPAMPYTPMTGAGFWQPTPPAFMPGSFLHWGKMTPFGLQRPDQFRSPPPPPLTSAEYRRDYNEVKAVGGVGSDQRLLDRANVSRFASMTSPVQLFNSVAVQLATAQGTSLSENARMFALLNMAIADATIAVFDSKYFYNYWRPVTAIRAGNTDPNPKTEGDPNFNTFINTPPYPSYPSGYGGLAAAGRYILERFFGSTQHSIKLSLPALPGVTLEYTKIRQLTDDIADARVYGGIHFRFDQDEAEVLGLNVAQYVKQNNLRCVREDQCEDSDEDNDTQ